MIWTSCPITLFAQNFHSLFLGGRDFVQAPSCFATPPFVPIFQVDLVEGAGFFFQLHTSYYRAQLGLRFAFKKWAINNRCTLFEIDNPSDGKEMICHAIKIKLLNRFICIARQFFFFLTKMMISGGFNSIRSYRICHGVQQIARATHRRNKKQ